MTSHILRYALLSVFMTLTMSSSGAGRDRLAYQRWIEKSSEELLRMGNDFNNNGWRTAEDKSLLDSAMICYSIIADRYTSHLSQKEKELTARALNEMGVLNTSYYNNHTEAYQNLLLAYDITKETGLGEMEPYILLNIGNLYNLYEFLFPPDRQEPKAGSYYEQSFRSACRQREWAMAINSYINFAMLSMPYGVGEASVHHEMQQWLTDSIPHDTPDWTFTRHFLDGSLALLDDKTEEATHHYRLMDSDLEDEDEQGRMKYMVYTCLAAVQLHCGRYDSAVWYANKILEMPELKEATDIRMETFRLLSEYHTLMGNGQKTTEWHVAYLEEKEKMMKSLVGLVPSQLSHDLDEVNTEVDLIRQQKRNQTTMLGVLTIIIALLIVFGIFIGHKNKQLRHKNQALYQKMKEGIRQDDKRRGAHEKYVGSQLKEEKKNALVEDIKNVMSDSDIICQPTFTQQRLAEILGSNTAYLSQTINEYFGMTFTSLLNLYRVKEACRRFEDRERYGNLTIDAISESVGFKARVTFTKAFRQHVGMLPSEYIKNIDE